MIVIMRAADAALDVSDCLEWLPAERIEAVWRVGDSRNGRTADSAGFNLLLAEADDAPAALTDAATWLVRFESNIKSITGAGIRVSIDIGIDVYPYTPSSVVLPEALLSAAMSVGAQLIVSAYPCSESE
jgi:hypothetical protein